jgi:O-6-methylguanine DNA methyltransferase
VSEVTCCAGDDNGKRSFIGHMTAENTKSFRERVFAVVRTIPRGKTLTYKEVATRAGNPQASRAVGAILRTNYDPNIPCHRVIRTNGSLGGYNRGVRTKQKILAQERRSS